MTANTSPDQGKQIDPYLLSESDVAKLIGVYMRICTDDHIHFDDPRRPIIAAEVLEVGIAESTSAARQVIEWWRQPEDWEAHFVATTRKAVRRMKLDYKESHNV